MANRNQLLNDQVEAIRLALDGRQSLMWTCIPGYVTAVDLVTMTVSVQPTIQGVVEDENGKIQFVDLPLLIYVPLVFPKAGGYTITFPVKVNDEVLVVFSSRCIDSWYQSGGIGKPMESRMHDLSDGFAIPGPTSQPNVISGISTTGVQIRNNAGTSYVEISDDGKIKLVSPSDIQFTGNLKVTGSIEATSDVKAGTLSVPTTISLLTHTHTSASPGSPTGPPLP